MNKFKSFQEIQGLLSVGYIYLIVLGILNETFYYNQIGIDILNYSSILDVLISPISRLTSSILSLSLFILLIFILFNLPKLLAKKKDKNWIKKTFEIDRESNTSEVEGALFKKFLFLFAIVLLGFFVGSGIGKGYNMSKKINEGKIEYNDKLNFTNGEVTEIKILGTNSSYVFYLIKETNTVIITPFEGIVKSIEDN